MSTDATEENRMEAIGADESFCFECSPAGPCFNECCRDLNQVLTPYDILRLKRGLGIASTEFIRRHAWRNDGPETGLPVITLKMDAENHYRCPFVSAEGCRVYPDRPGSCRMYPLARMAVRSRLTGEVTEHYALIRETHCRGFEKTRRWTAASWLEDQDVHEYNLYNDLFMELLALKNRLYPGPLPPRLKELFHMACYDLDHLRAEISKGLPGDVQPTDDQVEKIYGDERELLTFGIRWFGRVAFGVRPAPEHQTNPGA